MSDSELDLMEVQIGKETTWGTVVAPTAKLMGIETCVLRPLVTASHVPEQRGDLTPAYLAIVDRAAAEGNLAGTVLIEDFPYWLDGLLGEVTPDAGPPITYTHNGPGAKPTPRILSVVKGSSEGVYSIAGGIVDTLEMTIDVQQKLTFAVHLLAKAFAEDALETLSDRTVQVAHANDVTLYIDDFGVAAGTTAYTGIPFNIGLSLNLNKMLKDGIGSLNPMGHAHKKGEPGANQMAFSLEFDSTADFSKDMFDALFAVTSVPWQKVIRVLVDFDTNHKILIDFAGFAEEAPEPFADTDGLATVEFTLSAMYEATLAGWLQIVTTSDVASLV